MRQVGRSVGWLAAGLLSATGATASVTAGPAGRSGLASDTPQVPDQSVGLTVGTHLNFGTLLYKAALEPAIVTLDPATGERIIRGLTQPSLVAGASFGRAVVTVRGEPYTSFTISYVPMGEAVLASGAKRLPVKLAMTVAGPATLSANGALVVGIGGSIAVPPTVGAGIYRGRLTVNVAYE